MSIISIVGGNESTLSNLGNSFKRCAPQITACLITPVAYLALRNSYCSVTASVCAPTSLVTCTLLASISFLAYTILFDQEVKKACLFAKKYLVQEKYDTVFIEAARNKIRTLLTEDIGKLWLEINSFTLDEGIEHLTKICITDLQTCDGAVFAFLQLLAFSNIASLRSL